MSSRRKLKIVYKSIEAETTEAFYAIVGGMARESHLIKKLVTMGIVEPNEQARFAEIFEKIRELECCCGRKFIEHEH